MYVYFDSNGVLKEIITERQFRVGDSKRNKLYVYCDGELSPLSGWIKYKLPDGTETNEQTFSLIKVGKELPTEPLRNLKYFSYNHTYTKNGAVHTGYEFYEITIPDTVFASYTNDDYDNLMPNENNLVIARIRFVMVDDEINTLGVIPFSVETNVGILTDNSITESQYNYLIKEIGTKFGLNYPFRSVKVDELPTTGETGVIYYVKIENEEIYEVYYWNALTTAFVMMGTTSCGLYTQQEGSTFEDGVVEEIDGFKSDVNDQLDEANQSMEDKFDEQDEAIANGIANGIATASHPKYYSGSLPSTDVGLIVYSDGYLYSWNGTQYVNTGLVYQATQLGSGSVSFGTLNDTLKDYLRRTVRTYTLVVTTSDDFLSNAFVGNLTFSEDLMERQYEDIDNALHNLDSQSVLDEDYGCSIWEEIFKCMAPKFNSSPSYIGKTYNYSIGSGTTYLALRYDTLNGNHTASIRYYVNDVLTFEATWDTTTHQTTSYTYSGEYPSFELIPIINSNIEYEY